MGHPIVENELEPPVVLPGHPHVPHAWTGVSLGLGGMAVVAVLAVLLAVQFVRARPLDLRPATANVSQTVAGILQNQQVPARYIQAHPPELRRTALAHYYRSRVEARVPEEVNLNGVARVLERNLRQNGIFLAKEQRAGQSVVLEFVLSEHGVAEVTLKPEFRHSAMSQPAPRPPALSSAKSRPSPATAEDSPNEHVALADARVEPPRPAPEEVEAAPGRAWIPARRPEIKAGPQQAAEAAVAAQAPRVAIVVDDGGYGGVATDIVLELDPALTISVLPYTPFGPDLAERAGERGFEVLLHMPMENDSLRLTHEGQLETVMMLPDIRRLTHAALLQVPGAVGINNHTGSKFTANTEALERFMRVVGDTDLFFLDSRTTPDSQGYELAKRFGIPAAERTLFLDHDNAPDTIRARFRELMHVARSRGSAIGICHFRPNTAVILREMLPQLRANGIELVPVSELAR